MVGPGEGCRKNSRNQPCTASARSQEAATFSILSHSIFTSAQLDTIIIPILHMRRLRHREVICPRLHGLKPEELGFEPRLQSPLFPNVFPNARAGGLWTSGLGPRFHGDTGFRYSHVADSVCLTGGTVMVSEAQGENSLSSCCVAGGAIYRTLT